ncbi:MAG: 7-cyano-7-deazaguanine synthase QueC [Alphaproteobacteria bacterium]
MDTVVISSGGLDSVVLAHKIAQERRLIRLISFDYGQRHKKELSYARLCAERLGVPFSLIDLSSVGEALHGASALTGGQDVPDGHYAEETMRITVVPNRNAIFLTIAYGIAAADGGQAVATAIHGGDHFIYPDCRPGFAQSFEAMQKAALEGMADIELYTPFLHGTKADIVTEGIRLGVPFNQTWSCYKGSDIHCGRCGTCVERREAFALAGSDDPTAYEDPNFWKEACHV